MQPGQRIRMVTPLGVKAEILSKMLDTELPRVGETYTVREVKMVSGVEAVTLVELGHDYYFPSEVFEVATEMGPIDAPLLGFLVKAAQVNVLASVMSMAVFGSGLGNGLLALGLASYSLWRVRRSGVAQ